MDISFLTNYYNAKAGLGAASQAGGQGLGGQSFGVSRSPTGKSQAPTVPWTSRSTMPKEAELVKNVLDGKRFINSNNVKLDVAGASEDYAKIYSLYQGFNALSGLAKKMQEDGISDLEKAKVQRRFDAGMGEVGSYLSTTKYDHLKLIQGQLTENLKSSIGTPRNNPVYKADHIHQGSSTTAVKAFEGDVKFNISVTKIGTSTPISIDFDLSEMGAQTRSMSSVVSYMNTKLEAAGLTTRLVVNRKEAVAETMTVGGRTVTLSKGQDSFGLELKGVSYEAVSFNAPSKADSVFVIQATGKEIDPKAKPTLEPKKEAGPPIVRQILKFQTDDNEVGSALAGSLSKVGEGYFTEDLSQQTQLENSIQKVHATKAGPDGSVYALADVANSVSGQDVKGAKDVALIKYDSAGNIVFTRTLGAADQASGLAMSVNDDGKVAIAGSVTGFFEGTKGADRALSDSFVTVFDDDGVELFTHRRGATTADEATSVSFGSDGSVFVGGRAKNLMLGATGTAQGGYDSYLLKLDNTGKHVATQQFGTTANDKVDALARDGNMLYALSTEDGQATIKQFDISGTSPSLVASRNLGGLGGGQISALSVYNGKIYVGGSTSSSGLFSGATVNSPHLGKSDAFALQLDADLSQTSSDKINYFGGVGNESNIKVDFSQGKAWIVGQTDDDITGMTKIGAKDSFLTKLDVDTGVVEYQKRYTGKDGVVAPEAIAISSHSSSVLDRLGLPLGKINYTDDTKLVSSTSVRAGDQFIIADKGGLSKKTITIEANETLATLAKKIVRASSFKLKVDVAKIAGKPFDQLVIKPSNASSKMEFIAGPIGKDALEGLGISEGLVSSEVNRIYDPKSSGYQRVQKPIGLDFDTGHNVSTKDSAKSAYNSLQRTMQNLKKAYTWLSIGDPQPNNPDAKGNVSGQVPSYLKNQISNYQAALERLTGGS